MLIVKYTPKKGVKIEEASHVDEKTDESEHEFEAYYLF